MPTNARPSIWVGPDVRTQRYPKPLSNPKALPWSPPKLPAAPKRMPTVVDPDWRPSLSAQADAWESQADRLASVDEEVLDVPPAHNFLPIEVDLGLLLLKTEAAKVKLEHQLREWDRTGDGSISKGEFRVRLRSLGLPNSYAVGEVDELFEKYDTDRSGTIDLQELKHALKRLKNATKAQCRGEDKDKGEGNPKVKELRAKVAAAREAVACADRADLCGEELSSMREQFARQIDLALGALLLKRHIQIGEIVRLWPKPRGKSHERHKAEVSKAEFQDEVTMLNLQVSVPAPPEADAETKHSTARAPSARAPTADASAASAASAAGGWSHTSRRAASATAVAADKPAGKTPRAAAATAAAADKPAADKATSKTARVTKASGSGTARRLATARRGPAALLAMTRPVTRKELGALFDQIDKDGSGWLDVEELTDALRLWKARSQEALGAQQAKEKELSDLRRKAARLLKTALRRPEDAPLALNAASVMPIALGWHPQDTAAYRSMPSSADGARVPTARGGRSDRPSSSRLRAGAQGSAQGSDRAKRRQGQRTRRATHGGKAPGKPRGHARSQGADDAELLQPPKHRMFLVHAPTPREGASGPEDPSEPSARSTGSQPTRRLSPVEMAE